MSPPGTYSSAVADDATERNDVRLNAGNAAYHSGAADTDELVQRRRTANHGAVADLHVTAHDHIVGDDDVVTQHAIVRDVDYSHQQAVRADDRHAAARHRAAMDAAVFAHLGAGADFAACRLATVFQVLRR